LDNYQESLHDAGQQNVKILITDACAVVKEAGAWILPQISS